jgi:hypothetical protein
MDRAGRMEIVPVPVTYKRKDVHAAVQFKAGRMLLVDGKLTPDTRKGLLRIIQVSGYELSHLQSFPRLRTMSSLERLGDCKMSREKEKS